VASPQRADEIFVIRRGVGDHGQAARPGELDDVSADRPGRAGHRHHLSRLQVQGIEGQLGSDPVEQQGGRLGVGRVLRRADHGSLVGDDLLGVGPAVRAHGDDQRDDPVSHRQPSASARSELVHDAGGVDPGNVRRCAVRQLGRAAARAEGGIGRVHGDRVDPDPHLTGARFGDGQLDDVQDAWAAEFGQADGLHGVRVR